MPDQSRNIRVIVNADDYGYFKSVSQGILAAAQNGAVTATGIMANSTRFNDLIPALLGTDGLDTGVHLNLTYGQPLSTGMKKAVKPWDGWFPGKFRMSVAILTGKIESSIVRQELVAQIERCLNKSVKLRFINSHEHIHMLPVINKITASLAREYKIPFVRHTGAEWVGKPDMGALFRNTIFYALHFVSSQRAIPCEPGLIGLCRSGKLDYSYLRRLFQTLHPGRIYELMCHPGHFDPEEITDERLIGYHDWDSEYELLTGKKMRDLCTEYNIQIIRYRDLGPCD